MRFPTDGRLEMENNAAERAIRPLALGRRNWIFAGSDTGGQRAAALYTIIESAKMNGLDPEAYLTTLSAASQTIPSTASTNSCHGHGAPQRARRKQPDPPHAVMIGRIRSDVAQ